MTIADIQGNVICGYKTRFAHYLFAKVMDQAAARAWLRFRLPHITYNDSWQSDPPDHTLNVAFTYAGLRALGVPAENFAGLDAFTEGMPARAALLGDTGAQAPDHWQAGLRDPDILITLSAWQEEMLRGRHAELEEELRSEGSGLEITHTQPAAMLGANREHFGFGDGFSQPAIRGASTGPRNGEGTFTRWRRWRDLELGEFVLGHRDEGGNNAPAPAGELGDGATFMVVRKLEQDVAGFRAYVSDQANQFRKTGDWIAAKMVGRWHNGSPLATHPDQPGPRAADNRPSINQFRYGDDPHGLACPLGAHVRRANPRDALGWEGRLSQRHRLLRRGMSYGPELPPEAPRDDRERGLMFVCFQASIERQFEFVQKQWLGDGNVFGLAGDRDPLASGEPADGGSRRMVIQGDPPLFLSGLPRFVTMRGGGYFLLPGRRGLAALAQE